MMLMWYNNGGIACGVFPIYGYFDGAHARMDGIVFLRAGVSQAENAQIHSRRRQRNVCVVCVRPELIVRVTGRGWLVSRCLDDFDMLASARRISKYRIASLCVAYPRRIVSRGDMSAINIHILTTTTHNPPHLHCISTP